MTDIEKLEIIRELIHARIEMTEVVSMTASRFQHNSTKNGGFAEMYATKITAANAVNGFCLELLEVLTNLDKED